MTEQRPSEPAATESSDDYIRITPSRSDLAPETVVRQLAGLHGLDAGSTGFFGSISPFGDPPPVFEFLAVSEGADEPVEFYYGADRRLDALEERLRTLYPPTITFDRVPLDLERKLVPSTSDASPGNEPTTDPFRGQKTGNAEGASDDSHAESEPAPLFDFADQAPVGDGGSVMSEESADQDADEVLFGDESSGDPIGSDQSRPEPDEDHT